MPDQDRRVFIGVPVRNGADTIRHALDSLLAQTYRDITILISDNASTDDTAAICAEYVARDARVRYHRHDEASTAIENWRFAYEQADAPYFMWSADDDLHSPQYVEQLLSALETNPDCGIAFGQIVHFTDYAHWDDQPVYPYRCDTRGWSMTYRLWHDKNGPFFPYGVMRREVLADYSWYDHTVSPDWPLALYLLSITDIVQVDGPRFYYWGGDPPASHHQRAHQQSYRAPETFLTIRLAWRSALAVRDAVHATGRRRSTLVDFVVILAGILWMNRSKLVRNLIADTRRPLGRRKA